MQLPCHECALRACGIFKPVTAEELNSINQIKRDHLLVDAGGEIIRAGDKAPELYTLYSGWAFRFKTLPDGRRQILNFLLPGDLLGLQAAMFGTLRIGDQVYLVRLADFLEGSAGVDRGQSRGRTQGPSRRW